MVNKGKFWGAELQSGLCFELKQTLLCVLVAIFRSLLCQI